MSYHTFLEVSMLNRKWLILPRSHNRNMTSKRLKVHISHFAGISLTCYNLIFLMSFCLHVSHQEYWKDFTNLRQKAFFNGSYKGITPTFPILESPHSYGSYSIFWGSGSGTNYYQAISFSTIELSLAIKSSPLYPLLEMKLQGLSFISAFIKKILMHCHFTLLPAMIAQRTQQQPRKNPK